MVALQKDIEPRKRWYVRQIKHYLDVEKYPLWKVCFFYWVYRPFVLFVYHRLKLPVFGRIDPEGRPCWEEGQSVCTSEERAQAMIQGKRWWSYSPVYEDVCLPVETCSAGPRVDSGGKRGDWHVRSNWPIEAVSKRPIEASLEKLKKSTEELREIL